MLVKPPSRDGAIKPLTVFEIGFFWYHFPIHLGNIKLSPIHIAVIILSAAAAAVWLYKPQGSFAAATNQ